MSRSELYKARSLESGEWVYGDLIQDTHHNEFYIKGMVVVRGIQTDVFQVLIDPGTICRMIYRNRYGSFFSNDICRDIQEDITFTIIYENFAYHAEFDSGEKHPLDDFLRSTTVPSGNLFDM